MDARAYLTSQGWRGAGHSLHASDDKIGLSKPLLLNRRDGNKGLGQKAHFTSDTWWMNAFDEQLQGLSSTTGKDGKVGVVQTVTQGRINRVEQGMGGRWSLGGNFVRGGFLEGTIELLRRDDEGSSSSSGDGEDETGTSTPTVEEVDGAAEKENGDSKEERKRRRAERAARRAEKEARRKRKETEKAGKIKSRSKSEPKVTSPERTSGIVKPRGSKKSKRDETKEERRARKEIKRLKRAGQKSG